MRVFVSHSSAQKLFVKELRRRLPPAVDLWIDEHEIPVGQDLEQSIEAAISQECDLLLLVVDQHASKSKWVRKELDWALQREAEVGPPFLLPVVLDRTAWEELADDSLRRRKYLLCEDFEDQSLEALSRSLVSELLLWLDRDRAKKERRPAPENSALGVLDEADNLSQALAARIRVIVHTHRQSNPLLVTKLLQRVSNEPTLSSLEFDQFLALLERLRRSNLLGGIYFDDEVIYLTNELFSFKAEIHRAAKKRIAKLAADMVQPDQKIGIDGGSTTIELATRLAGAIRAQSLHALNVYTNSLPAASALLEALSELEVGDRASSCKVTLIGGWCRPTSMTVVPLGPPEGSLTSQRSVAFGHLPDDLDISFLGASGLFREEGFGIKHPFEIPSKEELVQRAKKKVVLADPSKFSIQQERPFAYFKDGLDIVSTNLKEYEEAIAHVRSMIQETPSNLILAS